MNQLNRLFQYVKKLKRQSRYTVEGDHVTIVEPGWYLVGTAVSQDGGTIVTSQVIRHFEKGDTFSVSYFLQGTGH